VHPKRKISTVTDLMHERSEGVIETATATDPGASQTTWERFEALYRSTRDDVYAYACTLLRDRAAAEDITALAFERAYRRRRSFDRRRGEERAWLFGIARNAALDELRRRRRLATLIADPEDTQAAGPDDGAEVTLRRTAVRAALAGLSARDRELIALKFHGGLTNAELAQVLGVSPSNAGTLLHRTMEKLREACNATA
jgi:RNA polymerase sigma-70 factor, ECF subfamily